MKAILVTIFFFCASHLTAGAFDLKTIDGKTVHITDYDGNFVFTDSQYAKKPLLFFFFGTRCPYCVREIPQVISLVSRHKIDVIGVQAQLPVSDAALRRFVKKDGFNFEVLDAQDGNRLVKYLMKRRMWVGGVPYYVWVDKYGNFEPTDLKGVLEKTGHYHRTNR